MGEARFDVWLAGGLGNQLFQYAFGRALAAKSGVPVRYCYVATRFARLSECFPHVKGSFQSGDSSLKAVNTLNRPDDYMPGVLKFNPSLYLIGYWQNERYFADIADTLRQELALPWPSDLVARYFGLLSRIDCCSNPVMVSVRRGDDYARLGWTLHPGYYFRAMDYMRERVPGCRFFVFSDDTKWCAEAFEHVADAEVVGFVDPVWWSLQLMGKCRHAIIANSTFSWWGAWLGKANDGIVVAPKPWLRCPPMGKIVCDRWVTLDADAPCGALKSSSEGV